MVNIKVNINNIADIIVILIIHLNSLLFSITMNPSKYEHNVSAANNLSSIIISD